MRNVLRAGSALVPIGALAFVFLRPDTPPVVAGVGSAIVGLGMGLSSSASIVMIQEIVDWSERGSVTAAYLFARSLGSTFGATVFGALLNIGLANAGYRAVSSEELRSLVDDVGGGAEGLRAALASSLHLTFVSMLALSIAIGLVILLIPDIAIGRKRAPAE